MESKLAAEQLPVQRTSITIAGLIYLSERTEDHVLFNTFLEGELK